MIYFIVTYLYIPVVLAKTLMLDCSQTLKPCLTNFLEFIFISVNYVFIFAGAYFF